jgi:hypothetical protein
MIYTHSRYKNRRFASGGAVTAEKPPDGLETAASIQRDVEKAVASGDFNAQADAYRRLGNAEMGHGGGGQPDDASVAFQKQIDALRKSEEIQRQRQAAPSAQAVADHVKTVLEHIKSHPDMLKHQQVLAAAADEVKSGDHGFAEHSLPYFDLVKQNFERRMQEQPPADEPEPAPRRKRSIERDDPSAMSRFVSAPVSRGDNGRGSFSEGSRADSPGRITLSAEQVHMAKTLGMSVKDYAEGLLAMREQDELNDRR